MISEMLFSAILPTRGYKRTAMSDSATKINQLIRYICVCICNEIRLNPRIVFSLQYRLDKHYSSISLPLWTRTVFDQFAAKDFSKAILARIFDMNSPKNPCNCLEWFGWNKHRWYVCPPKGNVQMLQDCATSCVSPSTYSTSPWCQRHRNLLNALPPDPSGWPSGIAAGLETSHHSVSLQDFCAVCPTPHVSLKDSLPSVPKLLRE